MPALPIRSRSFRPKSSSEKFSQAARTPSRRSYYQQMMNKYLGLARNSLASGNRVEAELHYQYADHYFRVMSNEEPEKVIEPSAEPAFLPQEARFSEAIV